MSGAERVEVGEAAVRLLLAGRGADVRRLDAEGFRAWLASLLARWRDDPVFARQTRIRDLRRAHPELREAERAVRGAAEADAASAHHARLEALERELLGVERALAGLAAALAEGPDQRAGATRVKLDDFRARERALREELESLLASSPERRRLRASEEALREARERTGLAREEVELARLQAERGRRSGRAGGGFETLALEATRLHLLPALAAAGELRVLRGVTLGAARLEIDQLVARVRGRGPVEALALVEAKRNPNDLAHGFRRRQENLAWLAGDRSAYDPARFRTRAFPTGHFDRPARHDRDGETHVVAPGSFDAFVRDPATGWYLERLCFVTRPAPLRGISGAALARLRHRVATDERFDPEDPGSLARLLDWTRALADPVETPEVLEAYAAAGARAGPIVLLPR